MLDQVFLAKARSHFAVVGPAISERDISASFPDEFPGKDDLVQFYLSNNGGSKSVTGGTFFRYDRAHRVSRANLSDIELEGFFSLPRVSGEVVLGVRIMQKYHASQLRTFSKVPDVIMFLERHRPIAFDRCGNDIWINLRDGRVSFMDWEAYRDGPIEIASSFREFVGKFWIDAAVPDLE